MDNNYHNRKLNELIKEGKTNSNLISDNYSNLEKTLKKELNNKKYKEVSHLLEIIKSLNKEQKDLNNFFYSTSNKLKETSITDGMTGVLNRQGLEEAVSNIIKQYQIKDGYRRKNAPKEHILFYFDLDDLKDINDKKGHDEGDKYILSFIDSMEKYFRGNDVIARIGGDEFIGIIEDGINDENFDDRLATIKKEIKDNTDYKVSYDFIRLNFGEINSLSEFNRYLKKADDLMYEQKRRRKSESQ